MFTCKPIKTIVNHVARPLNYCFEDSNDHDKKTLLKLYCRVLKLAKEHMRDMETA
jgi:hypothetical protein